MLMIRSMQSRYFPSGFLLHPRRRPESCRSPTSASEQYPNDRVQKTATHFPTRNDRL